jgi:hypothetical protein
MSLLNFQAGRLAYPVAMAFEQHGFCMQFRTRSVVLCDYNCDPDGLYQPAPIGSLGRPLVTVAVGQRASFPALPKDFGDSHNAPNLDLYGPA